MLVRCLYASRATKPLTGEVLDAILQQCLANNPRRGITGLLCHTSSIFVQVLEGGRDNVCDLFNRIVTDDRHGHVRLLTYEEIAERRFGNWTMGHVSATSINPALLLKYCERAELDPFAGSGQSTLALLRELQASGSISARSSG